jgi:hypothetical protein
MKRTLARAEMVAGSNDLSAPRVPARGGLEAAIRGRAVGAIWRREFSNDLVRNPITLLLRPYLK